MNNTSLQEKSPALSTWQSRQAAMLYHFASLNYLEGLHRMVSDAIDGFIDPLLSLAQQEKRDSVLVDPRWGRRNTSENWANNAWPFLKEFQASLAKDIAGRALERFGTSGANDCFRGVQEYSTQWATLEEEQNFEGIVRAISDYAHYIDITCDDYQASRWTDSVFAHAFPKYAHDHPMIPRFHVRTDVTGESGKTPGRTGVYVSQDDPNAALQFAWTGNGGGRLRPSKSFNEIGLEALHQIGRRDLWFNDQKMFEFALASRWADLFRPTIYMLGEEHRDFASIAVAQHAFVDRPCKWYFVEIVNGEFEDIEATPLDATEPTPTEKIRGGDICQRTGVYFTPAQPDSRRRLIKGEKVPEFDSQYGKTIWQWDSNQTDT